MRPARIPRTGAALAVAGLLLTGCSSHADAGASAPAIPLTKLQTAQMSIPRTDFCTKIPTSAVAAALDSNTSRLASYSDGDRTAVAGSTDTVAEDGCAWVSTKGAALARAWVFASAVDKALARMALRDARRTPGCRVVPSPHFGKPTLTQICTTKHNVRVRHAGLFGQSWLTCEITDTAPLAAVRKRADAWCVQVATNIATAH